jgi:SRSO17 transposase
VRERSARYLRGLLGPVERKNSWQVAEAVGEADPQGIQRLLRVARWDADAVRDELIRFVTEQFGDADGIFVVDETGFVKKGIKSVGVQRQYTGTVGKTENCQVGVFLTYVGPQGHAFLDRRLYLPQPWARDAERRTEAAVPETVAFQTKPELAWAMLEHAWALGVPGRWVTGDTVYGQDPTFRARLDAVGPRCHYVLAVPVTTRVWIEQPVVPAPGGSVRLTRRWTAQAVGSAAAALPATAWRRIAVAAGSKGPRLYDWAAIQVMTGHAGWPGPACWLLVRRSLSDPTERAYYLSNAPPDTPLGTLARVAGARWPIEQCFEEAKGETGLDHYEVRRYDGWYRHITLSLLAHTFLAELRRREVGGKCAPVRRPGGRPHPTERARSAAPVAGSPTPPGSFTRSPPGVVRLATPASGPRPPLPLPPPLARSSPAARGIKRAPLVEHRDEGFDAAPPGLGLLRVLDSVQNRIPIPAVEGGKERARRRMPVEFPLQVVRHGGSPLARVRSLPATISLGPFDFAQPGWLHHAFLDQFDGFVAVDLRPFARRFPRGEPLQPEVLVVGSLLSVDPAVADRYFERLGIGHGADGRILLGDLEPDPLGRRVLPPEPLLPGLA